MSQQQNAQLSNQEGRIKFALSAYNAHEFRSLQCAAEAFNVPPITLTRRYNGITHCSETCHAQHKLTATEEQIIVYAGKWVEVVLRLGFLGINLNLTSTSTHKKHASSSGLRLG
jgi:hypothetical protein